jgi:hypothetical protein
MRRSSAILVLVLLLGGAVVVVLAFSNAPPAAPPTEPPPAEPPRGELLAELLPVPAFSHSDFLNTGPDATYIGTAACAACHRDNHTSYALTAHSRALAEVDPADEPPDGAYEHPASGRTYRVFRKDGKLWHEELLRTAEGREIARTAFPVRYRVGSGHHSRTYAVEADGFLFESPITWYTSKNKWLLSPGYDRPEPPGFERPLYLGCASCHSGRAEPSGESARGLTLLERAIGCESCHGPGSRHREFHLTRKLAPGAPDPTIVHPGKLPRALLESVCASCHLNSPAPVYLRGREAASYRPGLPLSDFMAHYRFEGDGGQMTVVGHIEQLRQSKCYQKAPGLTCVTCHDPHAKSRPADPVAFYRQKCLDCHAQKPCSVPPETRLKQNPADNCSACHMPRGDTEVPHLAFTHHRIGKHTGRPNADPMLKGAQNLVAIEDNPRLNEFDRARNLGMAYAAVAPEVPRQDAKTYWIRARANLEIAYRGGARDAEMIFALAEEAFEERDVRRAATFAREALASGNLPPAKRGRSLYILAAYEGSVRNDPSASAALMEQAVRVRRFADDWHLLGANRLDTNQPDKARAAFQNALSIRPYDAATHLGLAECARRLGDTRGMKEHCDKADWLRAYQGE